MRKLRQYFYCIILLAICQVVGLAFGGGVKAEEGPEELTNEQRDAIVDRCDTIKENLRYTQREDSRTRVYLGRYYETILTKFMTPLNVRLVENNIPNAKLVETQSNFAARRSAFVNDFVSYSQALEELVQVDCKSEPERFYEKLVTTRAKRAAVNKDAKKMRDLTGEQVTLVTELIKTL